MKSTINWFSWDGEMFCRANFWDAAGRHSSHTFLSETEANFWLYEMGKKS